MKFNKWAPSRNYNHLDKNGRYHHGAGVLPTGAKVQLPDGKAGIVVNSNDARSLISHAAPPKSGASEERDWYNNEMLLVAER